MAEERVEHTETTETHAAPAAAGPTRVGTETVVEPVVNAHDDERIIAATGRMMRENRDHMNTGFNRVVEAIERSSADSSSSTSSTRDSHSDRSDARHSDTRISDRHVEHDYVERRPMDWDRVGRILGAIIAILLILWLAPIILNGFGNWLRASPGYAYDYGYHGSPAPTGYARNAPSNDGWRRQQTWNACNQEAYIRREMGFDSQATWTGPRTCSALGGMIEEGRLRP